MMNTTEVPPVKVETVDCDTAIDAHFLHCPEEMSSSTSFDSKLEDSRSFLKSSTSSGEQKQREEVAVQICYPQLLCDFNGGNNFRNISSSKFPFRVVASPPLRKRPSQYHKNKTPNTVKMLMEKHRDNERMRHHSLNEHLRQICKNVPGSADEGKETKVVMMQRIISYISYLENTAKYMCDQLGIGTDPSMLMLTSSVHDIDQAGTWNREFWAQSSDESKDSDFCMKSLTGRLKLSSPTIDSTTDSTSKTSYTLSVKECFDKDNSQDSTVPSSSYVEKEGQGIPDCEGFLDPAEEVVIMDPGSFDSILDDGDQSVPELPSSTFETSMMEPLEEIQWLGSPDTSPNFSQGKIGITCDHNIFEDQISDMSHTTVVSPNQILADPCIKEEEIDFDNNELSNTVVDFSAYSGLNRTPRTNKRKQGSPKRAPLFDMSNWADLHLEIPSCDVRNDWTGLINADPSSVVGNVVEVVSSDKDWVIHAVSKEELEQVSNAVLQEANLDSVTKLDLRKSSWMNGFMMFSRIHRRRFIKENPGIHTGSISKMLGNTWRAMTHEQQEPYREQARICAQGLQRLLDESLRSETAGACGF